MGRLTDRIALITGASRGFGQAIARSFATEGADVVVNYVTAAGEAERVVADVRALGCRALAVQADVAREDDVARLVAAAVQVFGRVDILVNSAGIMVRGHFLELPVGDYDRMMAINVKGTMFCTFHVLPGMAARREGRIINLSSQLANLGSLGGGAGFAAYAASKGAVSSFTRAIAKEFGHCGITVNAIAAGSIETDMSRDLMDDAFKAKRIAELPAGRMGTVDDVAHVALFLADPSSGFITGQVIHASGGLVMA
ncbi:MAG: glucose 1-dehydrogenase [Candidatus Rokubacteria bacterium]|nr:glucose 1-dehydrogenase [Candidatus Rokubacteria bacterium]